MGLLDRFTGKARRIAEQNKRECKQEEEVARTKKETMIRQQIAERRKLQPKMQRLSKRQRLELDGLRQDTQDAAPRPRKELVVTHMFRPCHL